MANPRYMNSKFSSTCCDCGNTINAGERIRYLGRSKAECHQCMPAENSAGRTADKSPAPPDWASALQWDDHEPVPGQSIGAHNSTPVAEIIKPKPVTRPTVTPIRSTPDDDTLADIGAQIVTQAADKLPEFTQSERAEGMAIELLIVIVNALDVAGVVGRQTIAQQCRENAGRASGRRADLWNGITRTINGV